MKTAELRKKYLEFFKARAHKYFDSDHLVPANDPTLLFTSAGMTQFKDYFLGKNKNTVRATSCQKCLRTGDLERVGKTAYHHTFFEMLGNFSFGDYFKNEAIAWAWEFVTKECGLDPEDLWVTVYHDDDESALIWEKEAGVAPERIRRYGADDNFWPQNALELGINGPCGPCSEIYFDYGADKGCGGPECGPACSCGRFVEVWNLVFTQYNCTGVHQTEPLPAKNIDTGMGLERMAGVLQGKTTNYDIDILRPIVDKMAEVIGTADRECLNAVTDHLRAVTFCIADGVYPSNEDRGYVVRKILRRALWLAFVKGKTEPFLYSGVALVIDMMKDQYPELEKRKNTVEKVILAEEQRFLATLEKGREMLFACISEAQKNKRTSLTGAEVFKLYDTYGFPYDLTAGIAGENGLTLDKDEFDKALISQKELSKSASRFDDSVFVQSGLKFETKTEFTGYDRTEDGGVVLNIIADGVFVDDYSGDKEIAVVLDKTPFYAAKGGQSSDTGRMLIAESEFEVRSVEESDGTIIHKGSILKGEINAGDPVAALVDRSRRHAITRAHTTTHILQYALRRVLGEHVTQQGSFVEEDYLRFDFSHFQGMSEHEIEQVEIIANNLIADNITVFKESMAIEDAKKKGALAFFEDKYDDVVRVISVGQYSVEFCGGTHLDATSEACVVTIASESSVASGIRRIEAYTGKKAYDLLRQAGHREAVLCGKLKVKPDNLVSAVADLMTIKKLFAKKIEQMSVEKFEKIDAQEIVEKNSVEINGYRVIIFVFDGADSGFLRRAIDIVRKKSQPESVIVGLVNETSKMVINISKTDDVSKENVDCGELAASVAARFGAQGGGKDKFGFCGIRQSEKLDFNTVKKKIIETFKEVL